MTSLHRILFNSPYHFLVDLVVIWCVLFFAYTFVFEDLPNLSFMDKSVIWKAGVHLAELVSFILILFVKKVGILIYIIAELMMLCFQIFTEQEETSLYIWFFCNLVEEDDSLEKICSRIWSSQHYSKPVVRYLNISKKSTSCVYI